MAGSRALLAVAIAAVLSSVGVVATGAVTGDEASAPEVLFILPDLHPGDQGTYRSGHDEIRFWFTSEPWIAANGATTSALVLHQERTDPWDLVEHGPFPVAVWFVDREVVAWTTLAATDSGGIAAGNGFDPELGLQGAYQMFDTHYGGTAVPSCGLIHSGQGAAVTKETIVAALGCQAELAFAGRAAVIAANSSLSPAAFAAPGVRFVLDPHFPVPTSVLVEGRVWRLDRFERLGSGPLAPTPGPTQEITYTESAIPDEGGIEHPFPLSQALADALADPAPNAVQDFLMTREDSYIAQAAFVEVVQDGRREFRWTLTASDGAEAVAVALSRFSPQIDETAGPDPIAPAFPITPYAVVQETAPEDRDYPASAAGVRLPTLSSLAARWDFIASDPSREAGMNAWGFSILCAADCDSATSQTWLGVLKEREYHGPTGELRSFERLILDETLTVDDQGRSLMRTYTDWWLDESAGPVVLQQGSTPYPVPPIVPATSASSPNWSLPSARAAASLTAIGMLAGLAYYLWPTLKAGAFALFRTAPPPPENEVRLQIRSVLEASPGIHFQELRRRTGRPAGTLRHHLRVLEERGEIIGEGDSGYKCYFMARGTDRHLIAAAGALKAPSARRMLHGIVQAGHLSMGDAAVYAGLTASTATHHALRLESAGLVTRARSGRHIELRPTTLASRALDPLGADATQTPAAS